MFVNSIFISKIRKFYLNIINYTLKYINKIYKFTGDYNLPLLKEVSSRNLTRKFTYFPQKRLTYSY